MNTTITQDFIEKKLDKDGRVSGVEVTISVSGGSARVPFSKIFPASDLERLEAAIKPWAIECVRSYELNFTVSDPEVKEPIDPETIPFDASTIITEARR